MKQICEAPPGENARVHKFSCSNQSSGISSGSFSK